MSLFLPLPDAIARTPDGQFDRYAKSTTGQTQRVKGEGLGDVLGSLGGLLGSVDMPAWMRTAADTGLSLAFGSPAAEAKKAQQAKAVVGPQTGVGDALAPWRQSPWVLGGAAVAAVAAIWAWRK